jgi:histidinol-phosphate aminotransferase
MSKGYSLAGLRFGYGIGPKELIAGLMKVKDSYNVDAISIAAATAAIKDQEYFLKNVEKVKSERERLTIAMREMGFAVPDSDTDFILAQYDDGAEQLYNKLVRMEIFVRYFKIEGLQDKLRITVGTREQNDKLIAALKKR